MNGNFKTLITIAATPLLLLSCSDEVKLATESEGENLVSLTVQLPEELGTRAFGEASKIKSLKYAVYPQGEQQPLAMFDGKAAETVEMTGLSKNVQLQLASGKKYDVIFWAAADEVGAQSKFDETTQVATLAPTVCSNEADDAFFAKAEIDVNGNLQQTVKLYRPYAQLNIGTDDLAAAAASGYTVTKTQVATQAYSAINLASGSVVGNATDVTFSYADIPDASEAFPAGSAYNYLSMNYVLVPDYKTIADVTLDYTNGTTPMKRTFTSVPLQRNYRTNIYGSLLTNSVDFNVVIEPAFIGTLGIATDEELADAASHHNRHVQLADNVQLALPANIAEGVVITGGTNSVLKVKNGYQIPNDNVTFKDVTLARDDSAGASDGCYLKINSDNVVLDNVKLGIINFNNEHSFVGGGIYLNGGKTLTVRNTNFTIRAAYGVLPWIQAQPSFLRTAISVLNSNSAQISPETENLLPGTRHSADGCRDGATVISRIAHSTTVIYSIHLPAAMAAACSRTANLAATPQPPTTAGFQQLLTEKTPTATTSMTTTMLCHA